MNDQQFNFSLLDPDTVEDAWLVAELEDAFGGDAKVQILGRKFEDPEDRLECRVAAKVQSPYGFDLDEIRDAVECVMNCDDAQAPEAGEAYNTMSAEAFSIKDEDQTRRKGGGK